MVRQRMAILSNLALAECELRGLGMCATLLLRARGSMLRQVLVEERGQAPFSSSFAESC
jgi:hypothetical protein